MQVQLRSGTQGSWIQLGRHVALLLAALSLSSSRAQEVSGAVDAPEKLEYLRVARDEAGNPTALQTAIVSFHTPADAQRPVQVDLIGAIHIAETEYFQALNKRFADYDVVLYELVAPKDDNRPQPGRRSGHPIAAMQSNMQQMLGLAHQLDVIDYQAKNLVHADMSPEQFETSMSNRNESFVKMFMKLYFREVGRMLAEQSKPADPENPGRRTSDADLISAFLSPNRSAALKRVLADQFGDMETALNALDGPEGSTIITERNKVALEGLREQLDKGHKKVAIFYGAGHMADLHERLLEDFHLQPGEPQWLDAWNLGDEGSER
ncbi:MAG: hypothetical protein K1X74_16190 [Pirellulales bacterium]|nr:hypothetical protein [Pirellulales bacterium]